MKYTIAPLMLVIFLSGSTLELSAQTVAVYSCVTDLVSDSKPGKAGKTRAVHQPSKKWIPGQQIRVRFLDGNQFVRDKVKLYAEMWEEFANVDFVFVNSGPAEIRVSFTMQNGSWSYLGKDSAIQSQIKTANGPQFIHNTSGASMNFGWFDDVKTSDEEFRRTTLHEFGHALGLHHEHQNKNQNLQWNEEAVYAYFAKQGWSRDKTFSQVLKRYGTDSEISNGVYDPLSIMHYYYPPELIKGGVKVNANSTLSDSDKATIEEMYPFFEDTATAVKPTTPKPTTPTPVKPTVNTSLPLFAFTDVGVDFEGYDDKTEQDGMMFASDFTVKNGLKQEFTFAIYFYEADGTALKDSNRKFYSATGTVAAFRKFTPAYANGVYNQFQIFMPYEEIVLECGEHSLKYSIGIFKGQQRVASTGFTYFTLEIPCEE